MKDCLNQNDIIHELQKTGLDPIPVRVIRVDAEPENIRVVDVEIIDDEVILVIDNLK